MEKKKVIVVGGGFAGLMLCRQLRGSNFEITLIDKLNHHQFQPLFYQVATASLEPSSISFPLRKIFQKQNNVQVRMETVQSIHPAENKIMTENGAQSYDHLVIATGCDTNYFGNADLQKYALPMKSTLEAIEIRNRLLQHFECIVNAEESEKEGLYNLVIVGAGPTGVELAGALSEIKKEILPKDYPGLAYDKVKIILLEGSAHTLNQMSSTAQNASENYLKDLGIIICKEVFLTAYNGNEITLNTGEKIVSRLVIWAAGVKGNIIPGLAPESMERNRYLVNRYNQIQGYENIFALGDIALMRTPLYPQGHPQLANVAINQGKNLANNLKKPDLKLGREYEYKDLGSMATIGKHKAVVDLPKFSFSGSIAWYIWMFLHLMLILSVKNKLIIFINWTWKYFTNDSSQRLILKK
jgi:NADH:ubiquinone reductase (H+-translocating)